jgi:hypothetical protein
MFTFTSEFDTKQIVPTVSTLLELPVYPPLGVHLVPDENHRYGCPAHPVPYLLVNVKYVASMYRVYQRVDEDREVHVDAPAQQMKPLTCP